MVKTTVRKLIQYIFGWPPSEPAKRLIVADIALQWQIRNFLETGTYRGDMVEAQRRNFDKIVTIELADQLYEDARNRFSSDSNITVVKGDSGELLPEVIREFIGPVLYWLDGHFSGGPTARGELDTPILRELHTVFERGDHRDVILIDDARLFRWHPAYPKLSKIREFVSRHRPGYKVEVRSDIIYIHPDSPIIRKHPAPERPLAESDVGQARPV
jgi:hypothetical protein